MGVHRTLTTGGGNRRERLRQEINSYIKGGGGRVKNMTTLPRGHRYSHGSEWSLKDTQKKDFARKYFKLSTPRGCHAFVHGIKESLKLSKAELIERQNHDFTTRMGSQEVELAVEKR